MCAGAIINARIPRVIVGAKDPKGGAFGSIVDLNAYPWNHRPDVLFGVQEAECAAILTDFFRCRRAAGPRWKKKKE